VKVAPTITFPKLTLFGLIVSVPIPKVTEAEADLVGSATLVAVTVTVAGEGTPDGAV